MKERNKERERKDMMGKARLEVDEEEDGDLDTIEKEICHFAREGKIN